MTHCPTSVWFKKNVLTLLPIFLCSTSLSAATEQVEDEQTIEKITVTARKIPESSQRLPFGFSVFSQKDIEQRHLHDARSFGRSVPGFNFVDNGIRGSNIPNIRGVGSFFPQSSDDGSVPVFVDGVPVPLRAQDREFFDIERIELLRGPQSTLYGRNAQAGAISIITVDPVFESEYEIGAEISNFNSHRVTALANVAASDTLAFRIAGQLDSRDGDIFDVNLNNHTRGQDVTNIHGKLLWLPDDLTEVKLALRYGDYDEQPTQGVLIENANFPQLSLDTPLNYQLETQGLGLTISREFDDFTLTSTTGYQAYTSNFLSDDTDGLVISALTGLPTTFFNNPNSDFRNIAEDAKQFSQELRINTELAATVQLVAGLFYFDSELDFNMHFNSTGFLNTNFDNRLSTQSYSAFAEATIAITPKLRLSGGLRYTAEQRELVASFQDLSGAAQLPSGSEQGKRNFNFITGRASATYDLSPKLTAFTSIAKGDKAGGFQLVDTDVTRGFNTSQFDSATTWTYEAGLRGQLVDNSVNLTVSGFFNDTKDENLQIFDTVTFQSIIENADTESYGFELETLVRVHQHLSISVASAWTEAEITSSADPTVKIGNKVPFTPSFAANLALDYRQPLSLLGIQGELYSRVEYNFVDDRTSDPQNRLTMDSFELFNLRLGWQYDQVSIYTFANNLLGQEYVEAAFLFGQAPDGSNVSIGIPAQPRRYGIGIKFRY